MEFRMNDIPLSDPRVADAVVRGLQKVDRALNELLIETKDLMPETDWNLLRRGVGQILAADTYELWTAVVRKHPQYEKAAFGD
jgi:hypothetical protein